MCVCVCVCVCVRVCVCVYCTHANRLTHQPKQRRTRARSIEVISHACQIFSNISALVRRSSQKSVVCIKEQIKASIFFCF
jgi:hypothetical protein